MKTTNHARPSLPWLAAFCLILLAACGKSGKDETAGIEKRLNRALELPTVEYVYKDVVYLGDTRTFLFLTTMDKRLLFSVNLRLQAGLDLRKGTLELVPDKDEPKSVLVRHPRASILLIDADERTIHEYFAVEQGDRFGRMEYTREIERLKPRMEKDARERGILKKAEENAKNLIRGFLELAGYERIRFEAAAPPRESAP